MTENSELAISRTEKKKEKDQEFLDVFEVVVAVMTEKINQVYNEPTDMNIVMFISFMEEFVKEENRCLADISYIYKQAVNKVAVDRNTNYDSSCKIRITTKKELEHYKKTGTIVKKEPKASKKIATEGGGAKDDATIDLTN